SPGRAGGGARGRVVPPRFLSLLLPTGRVFETVTDEADPLLQPLQRRRDRRQMFGQTAADEVRYDRQERFRLVASLGAFGGGGGLQPLYRRRHARGTRCKLLFQDTEPLHERRPEVGRRDDGRRWRRTF